MSEVMSSAKVMRRLTNMVAKAEGRFCITVGYMMRPRLETTGEDTPYTIYVHEILEYEHDPPTKARFLSDPFRAHRKDIRTYVKSEMKRGRTFSAALLSAGRKLQKISQAEAPVDTGAMRDSAFTVKEPWP